MKNNWIRDIMWQISELVFILTIGLLCAHHIFQLIYNKYSPKPSKYGMFGGDRIIIQFIEAEGSYRESKYDQ